MYLFAVVGDLKCSIADDLNFQQTGIQHFTDLISSCGSGSISLLSYSPNSHPLGQCSLGRPRLINYVYLCWFCENDHISGIYGTSLRPRHLGHWNLFWGNNRIMHILPQVLKNFLLVYLHVFCWHMYIHGSCLCFVVQHSNLYLDRDQVVYSLIAEVTIHLPVEQVKSGKCDWK